jgi:putative transposase
LARCGDTPDIPTAEGWLYLATTLDLAWRRLLGWSIGDRHDASLVIDALDAAVAAVAAQGPNQLHGTIFNSDLGRITPRRRAGPRVHDWVPVGRADASCLDNAVAENFFASLKSNSSTATGSQPGPGPPSDRRLDRSLYTRRRPAYGSMSSIDYWG